jgi:hypothetical protein
MDSEKNKNTIDTVDFVKTAIEDAIKSVIAVENFIAALILNPLGLIITFIVIRSYIKNKEEKKREDEARKAHEAWLRSLTPYEREELIRDERRKDALHALEVEQRSKEKWRTLNYEMISAEERKSLIYLGWRLNKEERKNKTLRMGWTSELQTAIEIWWNALTPR